MQQHLSTNSSHIHNFSHCGKCTPNDLCLLSGLKYDVAVCLDAVHPEAVFLDDRTVLAEQLLHLHLVPAYFQHVLKIHLCVQIGACASIPAPLPADIWGRS